MPVLSKTKADTADAYDPLKKRGNVIAQNPQPIKCVGINPNVRYFGCSQGGAYNSYGGLTEI